MVVFGIVGTFEPTTEMLSNVTEHVCIGTFGILLSEELSQLNKI
jgi:hypothetical protein